jgi:hypothetical protein
LEAFGLKVTPRGPKSLAVPIVNYMDPRISTTDRIKACAAAVAYERTKLTMQLRVGPSILSERLAQARTLKTIEHSAA